MNKKVDGSIVVEVEGVNAVCADDLVGLGVNDFRRGWLGQGQQTNPRLRLTKQYQEPGPQIPLYGRLAGGTIPFIRRYSTICP